ncbi:hypothetical protein C0J52_07350 [Blattella germanica]|nr:hypothetical protein C0J52_07350 [Blattella germanica]
MWYSMGLLLFNLIIISSVTFTGVSAEMIYKEILNHLSLESIVNNVSLKATNSQQCENHLQLFKEKMQNETWAMQMIDASTKIPESVFMGLLTNLGNFDECIEIENVQTEYGPFNGQHCVASLTLPPGLLPGFSKNFMQQIKKQEEILKNSDHPNNRMAGGMIPGGLQLSYCIPSSCSGKDFEMIFNSFISNLPIELDITISIPQHMCQTSEGKDLAVEDWITVGILTAIAMLAITSTIYDLLKTGPKNKLLTAFSWYSNGKKLLNTDTSGDTLQAIHGIRFLSICWVVMGHRYMSFITVPSINAFSFIDFISNFWNLFITNATLSVDTFFFLSGLLVCYIFLKEMKKENASFNILLYYFHRYIRLTPPYAIMILLTATLMRYVSSGPIYHVATDITASYCQEYWWQSILYINNYIEPEKMCVGQGWYLAVDMQLFLLSPIILYPLWKFRKTWSLTLLGALIVGGLITAFTVSFNEGFSASIFSTNADQQRLQYYPTHTRFTTWLIGVAFGFLFHETKRKHIKLSKIMVFLGWCIAITALLGSLLGIYRFYEELDTLSSFVDSAPKDSLEKFESSIYTALSRPSWALGVGWVAYACVFGYGGPVNTFLSWSFFQPLSRLSYCVFLVHMAVQNVRMLSVRTPGYISFLNLLPDTLSDIALSLFFAAILSL